MIVNELLDRPLAQKLWDYNRLSQALKPADFIFVMCSYNLDIADYAAILFAQHMGKFIVLSGGEDYEHNLFRTFWDEPTAEVFKQRLMERAVPEDKIIIEDKAENCDENIQFSKELVVDHEDFKTGLIVQRPYMERRAFTMAEKHWPEMTWQVTAPNISYDDYLQKYDEEKLIHLIVGDTWYVKECADKGETTLPEMPEEVEKALEQLINRGYTKRVKV